jgi:hypothetical protein
VSDLNVPPPDPAPPNEPNMFAPPPGPMDFDLKGKNKSKAPLYIFIALAVGGIGFAVFRMVSTRSRAKEHATFMEKFASVEKDDVGAFWSCIFGPHQDPGAFQSNIELGQKLEAMFNGDPKNFPDKINDECIPRLKGVGVKAQEIPGPSDYTESVQAYAKAVDELAPALKDWADGAKTRIPEREADQRVEKAGNEFHSAPPGKASADAIAYDRFMRCALPDLDKIKDGQGLVERLFEECKKPDFVQKARMECSKQAAGSDTREDKNYKETWKKFAPDDRDVSAWSDCFRKGRKAAKKDDQAAFGKAWVNWMEAGGAVRKIGAANLKND